MMQVDILDEQVFMGITPGQVERYLKANAWIDQHRLPNNVAIWYKQINTQIQRLWLPLDQTLGDFPVAMKRALRVIAETNNHSLLQVLEDLNTIGMGDTIRLQTEDVLDRYSTSLPLAQGEALIANGREMVAAAAMSELQSREVHPNRRPQTVLNYLKEMRLGQTEPGSYTIKLISPLALLTADDVAQRLPEMPEDKPPFSRRAVQRLMQGLQVLRGVTDDVVRRGKFTLQPFIEGVPSGISANLCDAISQTPTVLHQPLSISVTWGSGYPVPSTPSSIEFPIEHMPYLAQAASEFKKRNPTENYSIKGYVKVLSRDPGANHGTISIIATINGNGYVVRMDLSGERYQLAIQAHERETFAVAVGRLIQRGHMYWLDNIRDFYLIEAPELPNFQDLS